MIHGDYIGASCEVLPDKLEERLAKVHASLCAKISQRTFEASQFIGLRRNFSSHRSKIQNGKST